MPALLGVRTSRIPMALQVGQFAEGILMFHANNLAVGDNRSHGFSAGDGWREWPDGWHRRTSNSA
jgi:hypothetical protein